MVEFVLLSHPMLACPIKMRLMKRNGLNWPFEIGHCLSLLGLSSSLGFYVQVLQFIRLLRSDIFGEILVIVLMLSFFLWTNSFLFIF